MELDPARFPALAEHHHARGPEVPPHIRRGRSRPCQRLQERGHRAVYNKSLYRDDKRAALERWNAVLMAVVNGGKGVAGRKRK